MSQDALSDVLRCVRLRGALFFHIDCSGPWVTEAPQSSVMKRAFMPQSEHVMEYHVLLKGACWAGITGEAPVAMGEGDVVLFPPGDPHVMSAVPGLRAEPDLDFLLRRRPQQLPFMLHQDADDGLERTVQKAVAGCPGEGAATLLCGFLGCERSPFNPLLSALPRMIHSPASAMAGDGWSAQLARLAATEAEGTRPGGEAVLERMSEMMFVDIVRGYLDGMPAHQTGWLAGLRDRYVGRVLGLIHASPADPWTLEILAGHAGLSRSALHSRFVDLVGQPPMQYVKRWRMQLASTLLLESNAKLLTIAQACGYESEAAFSRTFKRAVGVSPTAWRQQRDRATAVIG